MKKAFLLSLVLPILFFVSLFLYSSKALSPTSPDDHRTNLKTSQPVKKDKKEQDQDAGGVINLSAMMNPMTVAPINGSTGVINAPNRTPDASISSSLGAPVIVQSESFFSIISNKDRQGIIIWFFVKLAAAVSSTVLLIYFFMAFGIRLLISRVFQ